MLLPATADRFTGRIVAPFGLVLVAVRLTSFLQPVASIVPCLRIFKAWRTSHLRWGNKSHAASAPFATHGNAFHHGRTTFWGLGIEFAVVMVANPTSTLLWQLVRQSWSMLRIYVSRYELVEGRTCVFHYHGRLLLPCTHAGS
jgi:hypothetical protein